MVLMEESMINNLVKESGSFDQLNIGLWEWNMTTGRLFFDQHIQSFYNLQEQKDEIDLEGWAKMIHPDDRVTFLQKLKKAINDQ